MKKRGFSVVGIIVAVLVVAAIGVATWLVIDGNNKATNYDNYDFYSVIAPDEHNGNIKEHIKTKAGTSISEPVYIIEFADFQCSACAALNSRVNQAIEELDGKLAIVYRNYLLSYHQNATAAASAAEAAGLQGYWDAYANKLFSTQTDWQYKSGSERTALFEKYFIEVSNGQGDLEKFREDVRSDAVSKKISFDMGIGKRIDIAGTPAFYIDGQWIDWADSDKTGTDSITIDGKTISWEGAQTGANFVELIKKIVKAKIGE